MHGRITVKNPGKIQEKKSTEEAILTHTIEGKESLIHPPSPGFRVTNIYTWYQVPGMFCRNNNFRIYFDMLRLHVRLVRALSRVFHPQSLWFSSDWPSDCSQQRPTPRLWDVAVVEIGRNLGYTKWDKNSPQLTERLHFTCGQLQLLTSNYSQRNWRTLLMGCTRASGAPGSSRRQPERLMRCFHELEDATQHHKNSQNRKTI